MSDIFFELITCDTFTNIYLYLHNFGKETLAC